MELGGQRRQDVAYRRPVDRLDADRKPVAQLLFHGQNERLLNALHSPNSTSTTLDNNEPVFIG